MGSTPTSRTKFCPGDRAFLFFVIVWYNTFTMAQIVMSVTKDETRMALLENGRLMEYILERDTGTNLVGSVYKGVVSRVVRSIQAAFIDIGMDQNAFLYMGDQPLTEGQSVLIQIDKDARGTKGPNATREITLPGKFVVLLLNADYVGISRKINDMGERKRLEDLCNKLRPRGIGVVVRTAAEGVPEELLRQDMDELVEQYRVMMARDKVAKAPCLLRRELDLSIRIIRDYLSMNLEKIVVDDKITYGRIKALLDNLSVQAPELELKECDDIFSYYQLNEAIKETASRQVKLPGGGTLVIDNTEAMTVIDVNSGSFNARDNLEETTMEINKQAAVEIARQLRLRDIGGIIVVDFIDMHTDAHKLEIMSVLQNALEGDRMRPKVQDITVLNLVEITRKKSRQNVNNVLFQDCPACGGGGKIFSRETVILDIRRRLRGLMKRPNSARKILLQVNPWLQDELRERTVKEWEKEFACEIKTEFHPELHPDNFQILDNSVDN